MARRFIKILLLFVMLLCLTFATQTAVVASSEIDIGADCVGRGSALGAEATYVDKDNPANASGIIISVDIWAQASMTGCMVGTFYTTNGNTLKCRDSIAIGNVTSGAKQTFNELSLSVEVGDYIGIYYASGNVEADTSGYAGIWYKVGQYIDPNDEATYSFGPGYAISLYGSGDTGAAPDITNLPISQDFGAVSENSTYETGLTYFTVTNNSSGAVTITIKATDFTGGAGWTLSDTAVPSANTAGLKAGLESEVYTIIVKKTETFNILVSGLTAEGTQKWGLKLYTPTTFSDGVQKSTTVTLTAVLD